MAEKILFPTVVDVNISIILVKSLTLYIQSIISVGSGRTLGSNQLFLHIFSQSETQLSYLASHKDISPRIGMNSLAAIHFYINNAVGGRSILKNAALCKHSRSLIRS